MNSSELAPLADSLGLEGAASGQLVTVYAAADQHERGWMDDLGRLRQGLLVAATEQTKAPVYNVAASIVQRAAQMWVTEGGNLEKWRAARLRFTESGEADEFHRKLDQSLGTDQPPSSSKEAVAALTTMQAERWRSTRAFEILETECTLSTFIYLSVDPRKVYGNLPRLPEAGSLDFCKKHGFSIEMIHGGMLRSASGLLASMDAAGNVVVDMAENGARIDINSTRLVSGQVREGSDPKERVLIFSALRNAALLKDSEALGIPLVDDKGNPIKPSPKIVAEEIIAEEFHSIAHPRFQEEPLPRGVRGGTPPLDPEHVLTWIATGARPDSPLIRRQGR
jgi:hypothetical protein